MNLTNRTGCLIASCIVTRENQDTLHLIIVTENGIVIRMDVSQVKTTDGRSTQGVKLIELGDNDRVKNRGICGRCEKRSRSGFRRVKPKPFACYEKSRAFGAGFFYGEQN